MFNRKRLILLAAILIVPGVSMASSHREAPFITENPKVDGTDVYMFRSYEAGRSDFVTMVMNFHPLQDAYGGPNYFSMDPEAVYDFNIDNNGDCKEDLTYRFKFRNTLFDKSLTIGTGANAKTVSVPLVNIGPIASGDTANLNVAETFTARVIPNGREQNARSISNAANGSRRFAKPVDNIGNKSIPNYASYAASHIYNIAIPGCSVNGRMFVGQRKEPFVVNLGETFDLINLNPLGSTSGEQNTIADKNITSFILEVPIACVTRAGQSTIGAWSTASLPRTRALNSRTRNISFEAPANETGPLIQVSRLGNPLVNEVVIGLKDKDKFNASRPRNDGAFANYVTNPTLPALIQALFPAVTAPTLFPRTDLVAIFLTGVDGLNKTTGGTCEVLRLNTSTAAVAASSQNRLGVIGGDTAGYPNGRRPGDDVVDISLRAVMGVLLSGADAPSGQLPYTDGALVSGTDFPETFPYLLTPIAGSPAASPAN